MATYSFTVNGAARTVDSREPDQPLLHVLRSTAPVPAALANAIFDTTGGRMRTVPFKPARVKAAIALDRAKEGRMALRGNAACRYLATAFLVASALPAWAASLLVSSGDSDSILQFDANTGALIGSFVTAGSGGLDNPGGLAFGPNGNLFVNSRATGAVLEFNGSTGAFVGAFVAAGTGGLGQPLDLAFGSDGNLYVANFTGVPDNILRFNGATGAFIDVFATEATFNTPRHIEFAAGTLWAAGEADRVWRFDAVTGAFLNKPQSDNPRGLVLGADGLMYVSSSTSGIFRHDAITGASVDQFSPPPPNLGDNDIAFGPDGNLYASGGDRVRRFDAVTGAFIDDFVAAGSGGLSASRYFVFAPDTEVPEPGTWSVLGLALLALAFTWVRRSHVARARRPGVPSGTARTSASR